MKDKIIHRNVKLEELVKMKQSTLKKHLKKELESLGYTTVNEDGYLFAQGKHPVLLVAHLDTVYKTLPQKIKYKDSVMYSPQGIGGDDRCGVYIILELLKEFNCSVVFTEDEEVGCIGAEKFSKSLICKSLSVNYIVEFDRRGTKDCVFYDCDNPEFVGFIESTEYFKEAIGSFSDICCIAPAAGAAAVNLSSGYFSEHTKSETIDLTALNVIINEAKILLGKESGSFEYVEKESYYNGLDEEYYEYYYGSTHKLTSSSWGVKYRYHVFMEDIYGEEFCCEVTAVSKMEAVGIVLSSYSGYTYDDIVSIYEDSYAYGY